MTSDLMEKLKELLKKAVLQTTQPPSHKMVVDNDVKVNVSSKQLQNKHSLVAKKFQEFMDSLGILRRHGNSSDQTSRNIEDLFSITSPSLEELAEATHNSSAKESETSIGSTGRNFTVDFSSFFPQDGTSYFGRHAVIVAAYSLIVIISLFGNLLVCHVVVKNRKMHTVTNTFIANLAVSDLLMTFLNIPFNVARVLLDDWPFGSVLCSVVPFVQVTSVYVSSFTMTCIALDRYQVIVNPLKPRLTTFYGTIIVALVWFIAATLSLPYAVYHEVVPVFTYRIHQRCQARFPTPALTFRKWLTLWTFVTQYCIPLMLTGVAYGIIARRVWSRKVVGTVTKEQLSLHMKAKRKTIKMLIIVVILFAISWLPHNLYHVITDLGVTIGPRRHNSTILFSCYWLAMSSVCYNPFIYCWLNENFRTGAKRWVGCIHKRNNKIHPGLDINGVLVPLGFSMRRNRTNKEFTSNTASVSVRSQDSVIRRCPTPSLIESDFRSVDHDYEKRYFVPEDLFLVQVDPKSKSNKNSQKYQQTMGTSRSFRHCSTKIKTSTAQSYLVQEKGIMIKHSTPGDYFVHCVCQDNNKKINMCLRDAHSV